MGHYHFASGGSVTDPVENFLTYAQPADDELIALDWEASNGRDMTGGPSGGSQLVSS